MEGPHPKYDPEVTAVRIACDAWHMFYAKPPTKWNATHDTSCGVTTNHESRTDQMAATNNFELWLNDLPEEVRAVVIKYPPRTPEGKNACYRSKLDARWHFAIINYERPGEDRLTGTQGPMTVTVAHGRDSSSPGIATFGQPVDQLVPCNCGKWLPPTESQRERARLKVQRLH